MNIRSLTGKSLIRLILLGIAILVGVTVVFGLEFYDQMESDLVDSAYSYTKIAQSRLNPEPVAEIIENLMSQSICRDYRIIRRRKWIHADNIPI